MRGILNLSLALFYMHFFASESACQLIIDAGYDNAICHISDSARLGGNPTASGGSGVYTYCWEAYYHLSGSQYHYYASHFLDDTTSANPLLVHKTSGSDLVFHLTVKDDEGNIAYDSCRILFASMAVFLMEYIFYIPEGDSIYIGQEGLITSYLPIDSIAWVPQTGVSSPHEPYTWVNPDTSIAYGVYIRDTAGCSAYSGAGYYIYVVPENLELFGFSFIDVSYDQKNKTLHISGQKLLLTELRLSIYSLSGKCLLDEAITKNEINLGFLNNTVVVYIISEKGKILKNGKLILF